MLKVKLPGDNIKQQLGRWGHTFTAITHLEGLIEVIMFGGSPGYYEVTWDVYKRKDFKRLSIPISFILGKPNIILNIFCINGITLFIILPFLGDLIVTINVGYRLDKEWELLDIIDCNSHWTSKEARCKYNDVINL